MQSNDSPVIAIVFSLVLGIILMTITIHDLKKDIPKQRVYTVVIKEARSRQTLCTGRIVDDDIAIVPVYCTDGYEKLELLIKYKDRYYEIATLMNANEVFSHEQVAIMTAFTTTKPMVEYDGTLYLAKQD